MKFSLAAVAVAIFPVSLVFAADPPAASPAGAATPAPATPAPVHKKVIPGQVIVPTGDGEMRRPWGELISIDLATRTGKFRNEANDEVMSFTVLPYAELYHHASFGDLQDFRPGTRAIFRLHQNDAGEWTWLTYIQDEMNFLNGHKERYHVDRIDAEKGELEVTDINSEQWVRQKGIIIDTDKVTRYWKHGEPAKFADIQVGDDIRTETHGVGKGKVRLCWNVFLDMESLQKFQNQQKELEARRLKEEGSPGYVDKLDGSSLELTLFQESGELSHQLKAGTKVRVAEAGVDRKPTMTPVTGAVTEAKMAGNLGKVTITLDAPSTAFTAGNVARIWGAP
jgi:hypothetical protein